MRFRSGHRELPLFARLLAGDPHVQVLDRNSLQSTRLGDHLRIVLVRNHGPVHRQVNIRHEIIARFHAPVLDRHKDSLLLTKIEHRLIHVLRLHFHLRLLDRQPRQRRKIDVRLNLNLKRIGQIPAFRELDFLRLVKMRLADHVQRILGNRLLIALADEIPLHLIPNIAVKPLFDKLPRRVPRPKPGKGRLSPKGFKLLLQLGRDHVRRNLDGYLLGRRPGILNLDLIGDRFGFLNGRCFLCHGKPQLIKMRETINTSIRGRSPKSRIGDCRGKGGGLPNGELDRRTVLA